MSTGLPLLSGPPPFPENGRAEPACRKCNKEFNVIFTRSRRCNHCGYAYCHNCTDFQALMPRGGSESGYDPMSVCAYCIEMLQITAAGKRQLRTLPLSKLKKYAAAYDIRIDHAVEKDDVVDVLVAARGPNGCLSPARENFYRTYSVPDRSTRTRSSGLFSRSASAQPPPPPPRPPRQARPEFARPDLAPDDPPPPPPRNSNTRPQTTPPRPPPRPQAAPRPPPRPQSNSQHQYGHYYRTPQPQPGYDPRYMHPPHPSYHTRPQQSPYGFPGASRSSHNLNTPPPPPPTNARPRAASSHHPNPPPQPTPSLDELVEMPPERVASLSIGALKSILWQNHVTAGMVLEKSDLVKKVNNLIEDEKRERERVRLAQEREDQERVRLQHEMMEAHERAQREREEQRRREEEDQARRQREQEGDSMDVDIDMNEARRVSTPDPVDVPLPASPPTTSSVPKPSPSPPAPASSERSGLCVVCQDEDANIAIVDCGHLCLCRGCCDMVMASSRECPLCRTRIVTEARLLRIFKA
ncbi:hypothetical protein K435DRAFT_784559 [Dendrothele bispora CBS 962.96]|uniref:RING-type domain-containing protein n=1 Tax=Dendrothele bispora (strain CBS 962.96) TaxID=1314807 RepID=A0A4S8L2U2_DENBC|nr:hypothetical protein K435DRAFT_784559 [Dendrothele bispora CBS 962.96]